MKKTPKPTNLTVVGLIKETYMGSSVTGHNCDFVYEDEEKEKDIVYLKDKDDMKKYQIKLWTEEGECSSGWSTATFGYHKFKEVKVFPIMMFIPKPNLNTTITFEDNKYIYDDNPIDNDWFYCSYHGGDEYYPSGYASVNMDNFRELKTLPIVSRIFDVVVYCE